LEKIRRVYKLGSTEDKNGTISEDKGIIAEKYRLIGGAYNKVVTLIEKCPNFSELRKLSGIFEDV
jgi:hypothetical protein